MPLRRERVHTLWQQARRRRETLQQELAVLSLEEQRLRGEWQRARQEGGEPWRSGTKHAALVVHQDRHRAQSRAQAERLARALETAVGAVSEKRTELIEAANVVRVWERLIARLDEADGRKAQRLDQTVIDQHAQSRSNHG